MRIPLAEPEAIRSEPAKNAEQLGPGAVYYKFDR
jgi:hypothetical protein